MKDTKHLLIWLIILSSFSSCSKKFKSYETGPSNNIAGTWELRSRVGGMINHSEEFPSGKGNLLILTDSTLESYEDNKLVTHQNYTLITDTCWAVENPPKMLPRFANTWMGGGIVSRYNSVFIELVENNLFLYYGMQLADGVILKYSRLN